MNLKKTVGTYLDNCENTNLKQIIAHAQYLQGLNAIVKQQLAVPLNQHCWVANYRNGCLIIGTESANWAFYLRYQQQELIKKCREHAEFSELNTIEFYIKPDNMHQPLPMQKPPFQLTKKSMQSLNETAAYIKDPHLKEILLRLANSIHEVI